MSEALEPAKEELKVGSDSIEEHNEAELRRLQRATNYVSGIVKSLVQ